MNKNQDDRLFNNSDQEVGPEGFSFHTEVHHEHAHDEDSDESDQGTDFAMTDDQVVYVEDNSGHSEVDSLSEDGEQAKSDAGGAVSDEVKVGAMVDAPQVSTQSKPVLQLFPDKLSEAHDAIQLVLARTGRFFTSENSVVRLVQDRDGREKLEVVELPILRKELSSLVTFEEPGRNDAMKVVSPPLALCREFLQLRDYPQLLPVRGVVNQPFLRPDGTLCWTPGYDPASELFGAFQAGMISVPDRPTKADAATALRSLMQILTEFPFADKKADAVAALSAVLTAAVRSSLSTAPMFVVTAPAPGTGKSLLCEVIAALATSQQAHPLSLPRSGAECAKVIDAALMAKSPVVMFDNIVGTIPPHEKLCTVLSSETSAGRTLGKSKIPTFSTRALFLATGNNVKPHKDMSRRCVPIRLDAKHDQPAMRRFKRPNLLREVREQRWQLVSHALTVIEAFRLAGCPGVNELRPLGSFQDWSKWCRAPLMWLGLPDPAESCFRAQEHDEDHVLLTMVLRTWHAAFGGKPTLVRDALLHAAAGPDGGPSLRELLDEIGEGARTSPRRVIGRWFSSHDGRRAGGFQLTRGSGIYNSVAWAVVPIPS